MASVALVVDVVTALLTFSMAKGSLNIRAAFLHNVTDAIDEGEIEGAKIVGVLSDLALNGFTGRLIIDADDVRYGVLMEVGGIVGVVGSRRACSTRCPASDRLAASS